MKRFLCILLCLMIAAPCAFAAEDITLPFKFEHQYAKNGVKGTVSITASGVADWLDVLLPFTASKIQVRLIGEPQGDYDIPGDDDWQLKLYVEDEQEAAHGTTYIYGVDNQVYLSSELLPDTILTLPIDDANIPLNLIKGQLVDVLLDIDPMDMTQTEAGENATIYTALAGLGRISDEEYETLWAPVLEKYETELDMWLTAYGTEPVIAGSAGAMTMKTSYVIPVADLKTEAKKIIAMILYDYDLQTLLKPHFTPEQQATYLNPALGYFYEACIDLIELDGDIVLEREMTALGETIGMSISLPMPAMPDEIISTLNTSAENLLELPYSDAFSGISRLVINQAGDDMKIMLHSNKRTLTLAINDTLSNAESASYKGFMTIEPADGLDEPRLSAAFACKTSHVIWQDETGNLHDDTGVALSIEPDPAFIEQAISENAAYIDFDPLSIDLSTDFYSKTESMESSTRVTITCALKLPDADVNVKASLRTTAAWPMENLPTSGAENLLTLSDDRKADLLSKLLINTITTMSSLSAPAAPTAAPAPEGPTELPLP